ncbi:MAG: hypothetical protein P1U46_03760 [Patescibacteria group bacterium]|nr:hypothetical protein [Patescibacteria group bacterium]
MIKKVSVKKNIIIFDKNTLKKDIKQVIDARFENGEFMLDSTLDDLHDPYMLLDMDKAVNRIKIAKEKDQRVIIFGDYDVD